MYSWEDSHTLEGYETSDMRTLVYIIRRAYREHGSRLPRGARILRDGQLYWVLWHEGNGQFADIAYQESPTMQKQIHLAALRLELIGQLWMVQA